MGILRGALNGLGKGLQQKAMLDWEKLKSDAEMSARKALAELEIGAADARSTREIEARAGLQKDELAARASEGEADRSSREKIAAESAAASRDVARMRLDARIDPETGMPYPGSGKGGSEKITLKDVIVGSGIDGEVKETWVVDSDGTPLMSLAEYQAARSRLAQPPPAAATPDQPVTGVPDPVPKTGGPLVQAASASRDLGTTYPSRAQAIAEANKPKPPQTYSSRAAAQQQYQ